MDRARLALAGPLSAGVTLGATVAAMLVAPEYSPLESPLSALGSSPSPAVRMLFSGGLFVGGVAAVPFAVAVWKAARNRVERAGAALFALTVVALSGVGAFPRGTALHFPAAASFYLLLTVALGAHGAGQTEAGEGGGRVVVGLAAAHPVMWVGYAAAGRPVSLAVPESAGALLLAWWAVRTATRIRRDATS
jgi:hypothetical membrane protein